MPCEDHAVGQVVGRVGPDGCHSLTAAPGRQLATAGVGKSLNMASSI